MIRIDVQPYCQDCLDFTPELEPAVSYYADFEEYSRSDTIIRCAKKKRCEGLVRYLRKQLEKEKDKG